MNSQTILVTGSSTGLGNAIARTLLTKEYVVFATMRDARRKNARQASELRNAAKSQIGRLRLLELDVTSDASVETAIEEVLETTGRIDVLINNAGIGGSGLTEAFSTEQLQKIFDVNVFGIHRLMRAVLPVMRRQRSGLIINISSTMGRIVILFSGAYTASKYALEALTEGYRYELAPIGVDVALVEPGGFASNYWNKLMEPQDQHRVNSYGPFAQTPNKLWASIAGMMQSEQAPSAQIVADAILSLIETPIGKRFLRTVVDPVTGGSGIAAINKTTSEVQSQLLEAFGLKDLFTIRQA